MFVGPPDDQGKGILGKGEFVQIVWRRIHAGGDEGEFDVALAEERGEVGIGPFDDMKREAARIIFKETDGAWQEADQCSGRTADAQRPGDTLPREA